MSFITNFFGGGQAPAQASSAPASSGVKFQTSVYGGVIPLVWGAAKIPVNFIGYGNFKPTPHQSGSAQSSSGGKGGGAPQSSGQTYYTYKTGLMVAVAEGPIYGYGRVWAGAKILANPGLLGFTQFTGTYPQTAWTSRGTIQAAMGTDGMGGYNGLAYLATLAYDLGTNSSVPNLNIEVFGFRYDPAAHDINPALIADDLLTEPTYGAGWPSANLGSLTSWTAYCAAAGILMSPAYTNQETAAEILNRILLLSNTDAFMSEGLLKFQPRGDTAIGAYTPPTSQWTFTSNDFVCEEGADPVLIDRKDPTDVVNVVTLEVLDRNNGYAPLPIQKFDESSISLFGRQDLPSQKASEICLASIGAISAQLLLQRQSIMNIYTFKVDNRFFWLDTADLVTIVEPALGISSTVVKIIDAEEDDAGNWTFICEEYAAGAGAAGSTTGGSGSGTTIDQNVSPGSVTSTYIFEPPASYSSSALWVCICAAGINANYGGCEIWTSTDDIEFTFAGKILGASRIGFTYSNNTTPLYYLNFFNGNYNGLNTYDPGTAPPPYIDTIHNCRVDFSESLGTLTSVSSSDALALNTATFMDDGTNTGKGEVVAYKDATLVSGNIYDLTTLIRGAYGSTMMVHQNNAKVARMDTSMLTLAIPQDRIGQVIHFKFLAFNQYGLARQELADVSSSAYTILGTSYSAPIDNPGGDNQAAIETQNALIANIQINLSQVLNRANFTYASGNYFADGYSTTSALDLVNSINLTTNVAQRFISPSVTAPGLIARTDGSIISNLAQSGSAFDGVKAKVFQLTANLAAQNNNPGEVFYIGKNFGASPKSIQKAVVFGSKDVGLNPYAWQYPLANVYLTIYGKNDAPPLGPTDGIQISAHTLITPNKQNESAGRTILTTSGNQSYQWSWVTMGLYNGATAIASIAQVDLYQNTTSNSLQALSLLGAIRPATTATQIQLATLIEENDTIDLTDDIVFDIAANCSALTITAATKANPCQLTFSTPHGLTNGRNIYVTKVLGMVELNGRDFTVTSTGASTVTIGINSSAYTTYTSGGRALVATWTRMAMQDVTGIAGGVFRTLQSRLQTLAASGVNIVYRITTANAKRVNIRGVQILWK